MMRAKANKENEIRMKVHKHNQLYKLFLVTIFLIFLTSIITQAQTAVSLGQYGFWGACAVSQSVQGWQFQVNEQITVTQLGLFDFLNDGFAQEYPIGLWRINDNVLLTQGILSAGTESPLIQNFRYCDVPDVTLLPGNDYSIAFYTLILAPADTIAIDIPSALGVDPSITYLGGRDDLSNSGLIIPTHFDVFNPDRIGPNFMFIPEPATLLLLGFSGLLLSRNN